MKAELKTLSGSVTGKVLFIALLILILLIPLGMIEGLILERSQLYATARDDIGRSWGQAQTIGGPILVVPFAYTRSVNGHAVIGQRRALRVARAARDHRQRGSRGTAARDLRDPRLHGAAPRRPAFRARRARQRVSRISQFSGSRRRSRCRSPTLARCASRSCSQAATARPSSKQAARAWRDSVRCSSRRMRPSASAPSRHRRPFPSSSCSAAPARSSSCRSATRHESRSTSNWPSPSFGGAFLPERARACNDTGFTAEWRVLDLGRGFPSRWRRSEGPSQTAIADSAFGVQLITPVGVHEAALRAAKYGVLIVGLTFIAYFLFELFAPLRLHALQYLLIGLANCVFYLLLLALAEHVGFGPAYFASAVASTALITSYSGAVLALVAPRRADRRPADGAVRLSLRHAESRGLCAAVRRARRVRRARSLHVPDAAHRLVRRDLRRQRPTSGPSVQLHA